MASNSEEKQLLLQAMQRVADGDCSLLDEDDIDDPEFVAAFNRMIRNINYRNTHYLMRINDSMAKIGNSLWIKKIFEIIAEQQKTLEKLQQINLLYTKSVDEMDNTGINALAIIRQLHNNIVPCVDAINEIIMELEGVKDNAMASDELVEKIRRLMAFNSKTMIGLMDKSEEAVKNIHSIYTRYSESSELSKPLVEDVTTLADSCNRMSLECFNAGRNIYEISRLVDEARNDMYRHNSAPTLHDRLEVFAIDHIVVTWRLYNHMQEYELLRHAQVDNPDRCKLGLWLRNDAPEWLRETESYQAVFDAHEELHVHLVACYDAKDCFDTELAQAEFEKALETLNKLLGCFEDMHATLRENGEYLETSHKKIDII